MLQLPRASKRTAIVAGIVATTLVLSSGVAAGSPPGSPAEETPTVDNHLPEAVAQAALQAAEEAGEPLAESPTGRWTVQLAEPSLATYAGGIAGLAATSPAVTGAERVDVTTPASRSYLEHLASRQAAAVATFERTLERPVEVEQAYLNVLNAVTVRASAAEAAALATLPQVAEVEPEDIRELTTDASQELIGAPAFWNGETGPALPGQGEGVVIGLIDTGVNPHHPAFAETAEDGYTHTNPFGSGNFVGVCDPGHPNHDDLCNDKLIGMWTFIGGSAQDQQGHGSHVASTMAGNRHEAVITVGDTEFNLTVGGTSPRANVISYLACGLLGCPTSAILAAVDQAVADGVHVLNYSISGTDNPWVDQIDRAFLEAFNAGVYISASAGNSGPGAGTVAKTAPWNASVAASTSDRIFANDADVSGPAPVPPELSQVSAWPVAGTPLTEDLTAPVRFAGDVGSPTGCSAFPTGAFDGRIAIVRVTGSFDCAVATKVNNAANAGAVAVLLYETNQTTSPFAATGGSAPAFLIDHFTGGALVAYAADSDPEPVAVALSAGTALVRNADLADTTAWFSSRGPSRFDLLAPTFAAPGVNVLAADRAVGDDTVRYAFLRGTSMAAPHGSGAGALLAGLHPDWSPAEIRSALALTAEPAGVTKQDGTTPADPFDVGSGRLDLDAAARAGLVLDETYENFLAANPAQGGDPRTLNVPALVDQECSQVCGFTREVTSVADVPATYTAQMQAPDGVSVAVSPETFTIAPGASQELQITVDVSGLPTEWVFASVRLATGDQHAGGADIVDSQFPVAVVPATPVVALRPEELTASLRPTQVVTQPFAVANEGDGELRWEIDSAAAQCDSVDEVPWLDVNPRSGSVNAGGADRVQATLDASILDVGEHTATICVASNDPQTPLATLPVTLEVRDEPVIQVGQESLAATQPQGTLTATTLTIGNAGTASLEWEVGEAEVGDGPPGVDPDRLAQLQSGLLLVPDPTTRGVMAFDPRTGDLVDTDFIAPHPQQFVGVPQQLALHPDGDRFLVTVQTGPAPAGGHVVQEFDLNGEYLGVFAPVGGQDFSILRNIRGITVTPWDTVLVANSDGANRDAVAEFDTDGNYLGNLVDSGAGGLDSPWSIVVRNEDVLVIGASSERVHRYALDGTHLETFPTHLEFGQQIVEQPDGNLLVAVPSSSGGAIPGIYELTPQGQLVDIYTGAGGPRGVHDLVNGNILTSSGFGGREVGVFEIDRAASIVDEKIAGVQPRLFTRVQLPAPCDSPGDVPWLDVGPGRSVATLSSVGVLAAGTTPPGGTSEVEIVVDSRGLEPGEHTAFLCVTSNDPLDPVVSVPITVNVTEPACARTVTGTHVGPLVMNDGLLCLAHGAEVQGGVMVRAGASLHASGAAVFGPLSTRGAGTVQVDRVQVHGPVLAQDTGLRLALTGNRVTGPVTVVSNQTGDHPIVISGNTVVGTLDCTGNSPPPVNDGVPNIVYGPATGQCATLVE